MDVVAELLLALAFLPPEDDHELPELRGCVAVPASGLALHLLDPLPLVVREDHLNTISLIAKPSSSLNSLFIY